MALKVVDVKVHDCEKSDLVQEYGKIEQEIFYKLADTKAMMKLIDVLKRELDQHPNQLGIIMISTRVCHVGGVHSDIEGMIYPAVQFRIPREEYQSYKSRGEKSFHTVFYRDRTIKVEIFKLIE